MRPIEDILLPSTVDRGPHESSLLAVLQALRRHFSQIKERLNQAVVKDGSEALTAYTVATRPTTSPDGAIIYVSDGAAGARFQGRHSGAWINLG